jgi:hypothetical protein
VFRGVRERDCEIVRREFRNLEGDNVLVSEQKEENLADVPFHCCIECAMAGGYTIKVIEDGLAKLW